MDYEVLISDAARDDLRGVVEFIAQDDPDAARRFGERLLDRALGLATLPQRFALHDRARGIRKMPLPPYLVFYVCDEEARTVSILHFWHGARHSPDFTGLP